MRFWPLFYFRLALERKYISDWIWLRCKTPCDVLYDTLGEFGAIQA